MASAKVTFANLVVTFGDKGLLDYAEESILPVFKNTERRRSYGLNTYFFENVGFTQIADAGTPQVLLVLFGQFVHRTVLQREQVYVEGEGLKKDRKEMESSPSSFFALIVNNHKLIFSPETSHAPSMDKFAATLKYFFRE